MRVNQTSTVLLSRKISDKSSVIFLAKVDRLPIKYGDLSLF